MKMFCAAVLVIFIISLFPVVVLADNPPQADLYIFEPAWVPGTSQRIGMSFTSPVPVQFIGHSMTSTCNLLGFSGGFVSHPFTTSAHLIWTGSLPKNTPLGPCTISGSVHPLNWEWSTLNFSHTFTVAPASIVINDGDVCTNSPSVKLTLFAPGAFSMRVGSDGGLWNYHWQAYKESLPFDLVLYRQIPLTYTVYADFLWRDGLITSGQDEIFFDPRCQEHLIFMPVIAK